MSFLLANYPNCTEFTETNGNIIFATHPCLPIVFTFFLTKENLGKTKSLDSNLKIIISSRNSQFGRTPKLSNEFSTPLKIIMPELLPGATTVILASDNCDEGGSQTSFVF